MQINRTNKNVNDFDMIDLIINLEVTLSERYDPSSADVLLEATVMIFFNQKKACDASPPGSPCGHKLTHNHPSPIGNSEFQIPQWGSSGRAGDFVPFQALFAKV